MKDGLESESTFKVVFFMRLPAREVVLTDEKKMTKAT